MKTPATISRAIGRASLFLLIGVVPLAVAMAATAREGTTRTLAAARVVLGGSGTSLVIDRPVVWSAERTYELAGPVVVAAGGTLTIEAGTRVEGSPGASIDITRDGRLIAAGTLLQPIVLTCSSVPKYEGCWGGLTVRGFARINFGTDDSPADRTTGATGCKQSESGLAGYGGCADTDSSGVIRYVRVEYAAHGLELLGVGSTTLVDYVQVNRSRHDGVAIAGGAVDVRHLFLTANFGYGLAWRAGWRGRGQFVSVQQDALNNMGGISGSNVGSNPTSFGGTPRSAPTLYNVTVVAPSDASNPGNAHGPSALHLRAGTGGSIRNVLVHSSAIAFDLDDNQTCFGFGDVPAFSLANVVVAGTILSGSPDTDSFSCDPYSSPSVESEWLSDAANQSVTLTDPGVVAALIRNATNLIVPDLRPANNTAATTNPVATPPTDGFFAASATYAGAIPPAFASRNNVPWYSGWTVPAPLAPVPGSVEGVVASVVRGPFTGAVVTASFGASTATSTTGAYSLGLPAGQHLLSTTFLPIGCSAAPVSASVASGGTATANVAAECNVASSVAVGALHACMLTGGFRVQCWGQNDYGMVGDATTDSPRPLPVFSGANLTYSPSTLTSGLTHTCALRNGTALCWGLNFFGALGLGTSGFHATTPVGAGSLSTPPFVSISAGGYHTCALTASGEAWCWGWNAEGQVGNGSLDFSVLTPTPVAAGSLRFSHIAAGDSHTCAITLAGAPYCWGGNGRGELGSDTVASGVGLKSPVPIAVPTSLVFASIDAGTLHTCSVTTTGGAYCWGSREFGQLGDGLVGGISIGPVPVSTSDQFTQLSAGGYTTCGVTTTQQFRCWGAGASGALGNGTQTATQSLPVNVSGSLSAQSVAVNISDAAGALVCAVTVSNDAFCWGAGASGQLGNGLLAPWSSVPVQVRIRGPF